MAHEDTKLTSMRPRLKELNDIPYITSIFVSCILEINYIVRYVFKTLPWISNLFDGYFILWSISFRMLPVAMTPAFWMIAWTTWTFAKDGNQKHNYHKYNDTKSYASCTGSALIRTATVTAIRIVTSWRLFFAGFWTFAYGFSSRKQQSLPPSLLCCYLENMPISILLRRLICFV